MSLCKSLLHACFIISCFLFVLFMNTRRAIVLGCSHGLIIITFQDTEHLCALSYILYRPVITYVIGQLQSIYYTYYIHATNWQTSVYMPTVNACMFHNKLLFVHPLHEHSTCHRLGCPAAVGFHTDLQLSCRMHR